MTSPLQPLHIVHPEISEMSTRALSNLADEYNDCLTNYRTELINCGRVTCPQPHNNQGESCKQISSLLVSSLLYLPTQWLCASHAPFFAEIQQLCWLISGHVATNTSLILGRAGCRGTVQQLHHPRCCLGFRSLFPLSFCLPS